ncbi:hypothetical protein [Mycolicibacterium lutetiense]
MTSMLEICGNLRCIKYSNWLPHAELLERRITIVESKAGGQWLVGFRLFGAVDGQETHEIHSLQTT